LLAAPSAGWKNEAPLFFQSKETKTDGKVSVTLPKAATLGAVKVTVTPSPSLLKRPNFKPYVGKIVLKK